MSRRPIRYSVPAGVVQVENVIKDSRFIATAGPAATVEEARAFIEDIRNRYRDATHNAWAFVIGIGDTAERGMSDDGEPGGTAGQPILARIEGSGIGDLVIVVTRYFGGTKLGTGGLVRAYGGTAGLAIEALDLVRRVRMHKFELTGVHYSYYGHIRNLLDLHGGRILDESFGEAVSMRLEVPLDHVEAFVRELRDRTTGDITLDIEAQAL